MRVRGTSPGTRGGRPATVLLAHGVRFGGGAEEFATGAKLSVRDAERARGAPTGSVYRSKLGKWTNRMRTRALSRWAAEVLRQAPCFFVMTAVWGRISGSFGIIAKFLEESAADAPRIINTPTSALIHMSDNLPTTQYVGPVCSVRLCRVASV